MDWERREGSMGGGEQGGVWEVGDFIINRKEGREGEEGPTECWVSHFAFFFLQKRGFCLARVLTKAEISCTIDRPDMNPSPSPSSPPPQKEKQNNGLDLSLEEKTWLLIFLPACCF